MSDTLLWNIIAEEVQIRHFCPTCAIVEHVGGAEVGAALRYLVPGRDASLTSITIRFDTKKLWKDPDFNMLKSLAPRSPQVQDSEVGSVGRCVAVREVHKRGPGDSKE